MDSDKSRDKNSEHQPRQEWEDPAFSWDEMKDGIFGKILDEEPDFFEEKPRRRFIVWFWVGTAVLLLSGLGVWQFAGVEPSDSHNPAVNAPVEKQAPANTPVAKVPHLPIENGLPTKEEETTAPTARQSNAPSSADQSEIRPFKVLQENPAESAPSEESPESVAVVEEEASAFNQLQEVEAPERFEIEVPSHLDALWQPLKIESSIPQLPDAIFAESENGNSDQVRGQWEIAALGGAVLSFSQYQGNSAVVNLRNDHTSAYFGYQFGVDISAPLSEKSYLVFGLNRQVVYQNIDINTVRMVEVLQENTLLHVTHYVVGDRASEVFGDTLVAGIERNRLVNYNEFKSVQAHAGYARDFKKENWLFSPFAGLAVGMIDHQEGLTVAEDKSIFSYNQDNPVLSRFQLNALAGANIERKLAGDLSLVFQYRFNQQWNNASAENGLALRPASHYFSAGVAKRW